MIEPIGVERHSLLTSLGKVVYYTPTKTPWRDENNSESHKFSTLMFLHGFGGGSSSYEWSKVYPAFASEYRVLAPDLIGWGNSEHPQRNYQPDDYINNIIEIIEDTCNEPITVIASSLTAAFTIRVAILRPDLFQSLILTTPAGLSDFGENYSNNFFVRLVGTPIIDKLIYSAGIANSAGILNFLENKQFADPQLIYPEIVQAYLTSAQQPNAEYSALSFVRGDLCFDLATYIPQLNIPTAMIWGQKSQFTGPEIGKRLASLNPQSIKFFQEIENVGLTPQLELPAVTIGLIRKYISLLNSGTNDVAN